jgi:hypothetical protein
MLLLVHQLYWNLMTIFFKNYSYILKNPFENGHNYSISNKILFYSNWLFYINLWNSNNLWRNLKFHVILISDISRFLCFCHLEKNHVLFSRKNLFFIKLIILLIGMVRLILWMLDWIIIMFINIHQFPMNTPSILYSHLCILIIILYVIINSLYLLKFNYKLSLMILLINFIISYNHIFHILDIPSIIYSNYILLLFFLVELYPYIHFLQLHENILITYNFCFDLVRNINMVLHILLSFIYFSFYNIMVYIFFVSLKKIGPTWITNLWKLF